MFARGMFDCTYYVCVGHSCVCGTVQACDLVCMYEHVHALVPFERLMPDLKPEHKPFMLIPQKTRSGEYQRLHPSNQVNTLIRVTPCERTGGSESLTDSTLR